MTLPYGKGQGSRRRIRVVHDRWNPATSVGLVADMDLPACLGVDAATGTIHGSFTAAAIGTDSLIPGSTGIVGCRPDEPDGNPR